MVFYRKYRPQTIDEIIGQANVKQLLTKLSESGNFAHAYLFCGPRGTGKTSTARIVAKLVNCENFLSSSRASANRGSINKNDQLDSPALAGGNDSISVPCNSCSQCISITDGSNLDLIEIDAASNRGIDDIRELRERIKLAPTQARKKVYIIDEVHMLTTEAFNALLKTLEEPPEHVLFVLATTEPHKIPQTILSRVQRLDFKEASVEDLIEALKNVAKSEKITADEEILRAIAKAGEGSFRDSLKILDQLAAIDLKITLGMVENFQRQGGFTDLVALLDGIASKNAKKGLEVISKQVEAGVNVKEFTVSLLDLLRSILLLKHGSDVSVKEEYGSNKYDEIKNLTEKFSIEQLIKVLDLIHGSLEKLKYASIPSLPLELAVVESCMNSEFSVKSGELKRENTVILGTNKVRTPESKQESDSGQVLRQAQDPERSRGARMTEDGIATSPPAPPNDKGSDDVSESSEDKVILLDKWTYILETVKPYNYSLEALLKQTKIKSCEDGRVVLEVPYSFHQRILEAPKSRSLLESVMSDVLEKSVVINTVLGQRPTRIEEIANVEVAADDEVIRIAAEIFNSES